jgi:hypothetical protein
LATFLPLFVKYTKNSAADFSGRSYFYGATFVFCGRNFGQLATLVMFARADHQDPKKFAEQADELMGSP